MCAQAHIYVNVNIKVSEMSPELDAVQSEDRKLREQLTTSNQKEEKTK